MHNLSFTVPGQLPGLNELLDARRRRWRKGGGDAYTTLKRAAEKQVTASLAMAGFRPGDAVPVPVRLVFRWFCRDRRRDPDNVAAGGRKVILDALVRYGTLPGDGWRHVAGWQDEFFVDRRQPRIEISIICGSGVHGK